MLNCKLCDYYKPLSDNGASNKIVARCDFMNISISDDFEKLETEYPCGKVGYQDYLNRTSE
jgi:hypothetical protein